MLAGVVRKSRRLCAVVTLDIVSELTENAHWHVPEFPADFRWQIKNQQAVDTGLVRGRRGAVGQGRVAADEMNVKRVTVTGIVIQRRRQLDVNAVRESKSRACLPRQHEGVRYWNFLAC